MEFTKARRIRGPKTDPPKSTDRPEVKDFAARKFRPARIHSFLGPPRRGPGEGKSCRATTEFEILQKRVFKKETSKKISGRQDIVKESKKKPEPPTRALNDPRDN